MPETEPRTDPMSVDIASIREEHIEGYHAALDVVARERRYLSFLEAPPIALRASSSARASPSAIRISWPWTAIVSSAGAM